MISVACLEQGLELSAQCAIITGTVFIITVIKAHTVPLGQEMQAQTPGPGGQHKWGPMNWVVCSSQ